MALTPGPWTWTTSNVPAHDDGSYPDRATIDDIGAFQSTGYYGNPELYGPDWDGMPVVSAGGGEYTAVRNPADARAIAAVPQMIAALQDIATGDDTSTVAGAVAIARAALAAALGTPEA